MKKHIQTILLFVTVFLINILITLFAKYFPMAFLCILCPLALGCLYFYFLQHFKK